MEKQVKIQYIFYFVKNWNGNTATVTEFRLYLKNLDFQTTVCLIHQLLLIENLTQHVILSLPVYTKTVCCC